MSVGDQNNAQQSDVIIVLGAGLRRDGRAGDALWRRSLVAAQAFHEGLAPNIVCTGGVSQTQTRSEADACREILIGEGVSPDAIMLEDGSHSTEENALNTRAIMAARGWQSAIIVTDSFHMMRAGWIFSASSASSTSRPPIFCSEKAIPLRRFICYWELRCAHLLQAVPVLSGHTLRARSQRLVIASVSCTANRPSLRRWMA
jgi:hypothetical protein